ncbi:Component of a membrane-bound complex containing the Tor2p kinase, partial [Kickxella alabastrina]
GESSGGRRAKQSNRNAKVAPTREGREEVVGLGVVPQHPDVLDAYSETDTMRRSLDTVRQRRPQAMVADKTWSEVPVVVPPRRSLDILSPPPMLPPQLMPGVLASESAAAEALVARNPGVATIRLQRPSEVKRKGSVRDAIALGIDFDLAALAPPTAARTSSSAKSSEESTRDAPRVSLSALSASTASLSAPRPQPQPPRSTKRSDASFKIPLSNLREDRPPGSASNALKRSATLPTKRPGGVAGQRSRWADVSVKGKGSGSGSGEQQRQPTSQASGWVGGAQTSWDHSSSDGSDDEPRGPRRGPNTHTWYGPRAGIRPISMFPPPMPKITAPYAVPPMPLLFGADDSDDDIDLEGDEGSSRTPALMGMPTFAGAGAAAAAAAAGRATGLRALMASPAPQSPPSRAESLGKESRLVARLRAPPGASVPAAVSPLGATLVASAVAASSKYGHLARETSSPRPRGISDPNSAAKDTLQLGSAAAPRLRTPTMAGSAAVHSPARAVSVAAAAAAAVALEVPVRSASSCDLLVSGLASGRAGALPQAADPAPRSPPLYVPPTPPKTSGLAALLASKLEVRTNAFAEEFATVGSAGGSATAGGSGGRPFALKIFMFHATDAKSQALDISVRATATVEQTIGYALYQYIEDGCAPELAKDALDVVEWVLHVADDGQVDDDFPVLDRTRQVSQFACDEFALCRASAEQVKLNEGIRVRQGRLPRMARSHASMLPMPVPVPVPATSIGDTREAEEDVEGGVRELRFRIVPRKETSAVVLQPSRIAIASTAGIFVGNSILAAAAAADPTALPPIDALRSPHALGSRFLKIRVLGDSASAESLRTTTVVTSANATVSAALAQVRRKKPFSDEQYVLGTIEGGRFIVCDPDLLVSDVPLSKELCLHKPNAPLPSPESLALYGKHWSVPIDDQNQQPSAVGAAAVEGAHHQHHDLPHTSSLYYTFPVVRRAQMFTRHDRLLVIDGEVVTLMPADHRTESAKTLTFHISNIVCKRNQRSPKKIRLVVLRRSSSAEKSVDLETASEEDAVSICSILVRMREIYANNNGGSV